MSTSIKAQTIRWYDVNEVSEDRSGIFTLAMGNKENSAPNSEGLINRREVAMIHTPFDAEYCNVKFHRLPYASKRSIF